MTRISDLTLGHRLRIEERFIEDVSGVVVRMRYRLRTAYPETDSRWYLVISDEVFANLNERGAGPAGGFEQNRLFGGVGFHPTARLRVEAGYQWRHLERRELPSRTDHVIAIALFYDTMGRIGGPTLKRHHGDH